MFLLWQFLMSIRKVSQTLFLQKPFLLIMIPLLSLISGSSRLDCSAAIDISVFPSGIPTSVSTCSSSCFRELLRQLLSFYPPFFCYLSSSFLFFLIVFSMRITSHALTCALLEQMKHFFLFQLSASDLANLHVVGQKRCPEKRLRLSGSVQTFQLFLSVTGYVALSAKH